MKSKNRNILSLLGLLALCALLGRSMFVADRLESLDPNQLIVETRLGQSSGDTLVLRRGQQKLFPLPRFARWSSGAEREQVYAALGPPELRFEFLGSEYLVWRANVRYDWDLDNKFAGRYLSMHFNGGDYAGSLTISNDPPLDAVPIE